MVSSRNCSDLISSSLDCEIKNFTLHSVLSVEQSSVLKENHLYIDALSTWPVELSRYIVDCTIVCKEKVEIVDDEATNEKGIGYIKFFKKDKNNEKDFISISLTVDAEMYKKIGDYLLQTEILPSINKSISFSTDQGLYSDWKEKKTLLTSFNFTVSNIVND